MTWAVLLGSAAMLALVLFGPRLGQRLPPAMATRLMGAAAVAVAAITLWVLAVLAFTAIAQVPLVAAFGDWSTEILHATDPVPMWVGVLSALLWLGAAALAVRGFAQRLAALAALRRLGATVRPVGSLVIVDSDQPVAFSTTAGRGRVYVSTGMLRALRPDERRALLAHEASHLEHRHAWWLIASDLAAVVNPALVPTARAIAHGVERWADEDAARSVGDRCAVARALARAALHTQTASTGTGIAPAARNAVATAAVSGRVPDRVEALLLAPPRARLLPALVLAVLLAATIGSGLAIQSHTEAYFDHASACPGPACGQRPHFRLPSHLPSRQPGHNSGVSQMRYGATAGGSRRMLTASLDRLDSVDRRWICALAGSRGEATLQ